MALPGPGSAHFGPQTDFFILVKNAKFGKKLGVSSLLGGPIWPTSSLQLTTCFEKAAFVMIPRPGSLQRR